MWVFVFDKDCIAKGGGVAGAVVIAHVHVSGDCGARKARSATHLRRD